MFDQKQKQLISKKTTTTAGKSTTSGNAFLQAGLKGAAKTRSGNGAVKFSTTGQPFVDQFGQCANYKAPRKFDDVATSSSTLWGLSKLVAIKFALYLRLITRVAVYPDGSKTEKVQRGQGLKHEGIYRMMWLAVNYPDTFWKNVHLFITAGSWKDIITMLSYDLQFHGWDDRKLDWNKFGKLILAGLENDKTTNLVKKYLPQVKTNSRCKTLEAQADNIIAKWICSLLFGGKEDSSSYKKYRQLKTSGNAHEWQKIISQGKHLKIDFNTIHGRALSQLVSSKYLKNQGLEKKYEDWLAKKPIAKFTGYVYELMAGVGAKASKQYQIDTINKQFMGLVETAQKGAKKGTSLIVVRDTSGSMGSAATGTKISCYDVAKSLALFFSYLLPKGHFADSWIEFNSDAKMHQWRGNTPVEKWNNDHTSYVGSTDFQKVIRLFCQIKKQGVKESEFPTGILCISDGEFNPAQLGKTNVEAARATLKANGFSAEYVKNFQIILWNLGNMHYGRVSGNKFETYGEAENVFYFSGLDGSVVTFLTGMEGSTKPAPKTDAELFDAAMDQELLNEVEV